MQIRSVHERHISAPAAAAAALLETLSSDDDRLWRSRLPVRVVLDDGLRVGSSGGHGPVRYHVLEHGPGRLVFGFDPPTGLEGTHRFEVLDHPDGTCTLRHTLEGRATGAARTRWVLGMHPLHDLVVEDVLDAAELELTGTSHRVQPAPVRARVLVAAIAALRRREPAGRPAVSRPGAGQAGAKTSRGR